ncbi:MAG: SsrA-binding protein SmpB [Bacilli bacterium]|nr:SsrA-binding protein SmpB [Bacilli bacterium]
MEIINREARYNYFIIEEIECGIVLTGTEIKAIRNSKMNLKDSYAVIRKNEVFLLNTHISEYKEGNIFNHDPRRTRKLLLHKSEILKLNNKVNQEGLTLIPLKLYFKKNKVKVLLGLCKGKKNFDKRETIKERDLKKEASKLEKYNYK